MDNADLRGGANTGDNSVGDRIESNAIGSCVTFTVWKGEEANEALQAAAKISNCDKDFIRTMCAENGEFTPKRKHPNRNNDGSWDYSFGLNSYYHMPMINKILNDEVSNEEIMQYHYNIYSGKEWTTSCGQKPFCGFNRRSACDKILKFN